MDGTRATDITRRVCRAWFVMSGLSGEGMPDLSDVTEGTALAAAEIVRALPPVTGPDGAVTRPATVDDGAIPLVLAMAARVARTDALPANAVARGCLNAWLSLHGIPGLADGLAGVPMAEALDAVRAARAVPGAFALSDLAVVRIYRLRGGPAERL